MENDIQEQLAHQQEILRDLQSQLAQSTDEEEKKSLQLKMNVVDAKIKELQAKQSSATVNEGTPENTKIFHNELTDEQLDEDSWKVGDKSIAVAFNGLIKENANMLNESLPSNYSKSKYLKEVQDATKAIRSVCDRIDKLAKKGDEWSMYSLPSDFKSIANFAERCAEDSKDIYSYMKKGTLTEGCMTKKFENMTNREIASYIFSHPHTKFASKMKECDDKEIMKAIRAMRKTEEEAPVTNTSAVATPEVPSMFMKKKLNS